MADSKDRQSGKSGAQKGTPAEAAAGTPPSPAPAAETRESPGVLGRLRRRVTGGGKGENGVTADPFLELHRAFLCAHQDALAEAERRHLEARHTLTRLQRDPALEAQRRVENAHQRFMQVLTSTSRDPDAQQQAATAYNDFVREQRDAYAQAQQAAADAAQSHAGEVREIQEEVTEALRAAYRTYVQAHKAAFAALDDDADPGHLHCAAQSLFEVAQWAGATLPRTRGETAAGA